MCHRLFLHAAAAAASLLGLCAGLAAADAASEATPDYTIPPKPVALSTQLLSVAEASGVYDQRQLAKGWRVPAAERLQRLADKRIILGVDRGSALDDGLHLLRSQEPELKHLPLHRNLSASSLKEGGISRTSIGPDRRPEQRLQHFATALAEKDYAADSHFALLGFEAEDISSGRQVEYVTDQRLAVMEIRTYHVGLSNVFTDSITTVSNLNGVRSVNSYPIELPNREIIGLSTTAAVPMGGGASSVRRLSPRYPGLAFAMHERTFEVVNKAYPQLRLAAMTVPLEDDNNLQRNHYNTLLRRQAASSGRPLLDAAAILSHGPDGDLASDQQGPHLHPAWRHERRRDTINEAGKRRLAEVFISMLDRELAQ